MHKATFKRRVRQEKFLEIYEANPTLSVAQCAERTGIQRNTVTQWAYESRLNDGWFQTRYEQAGKARKAAVRAAKIATGGELVIDPDRTKPKKPGFEQWRRTYLGRPVTRHQKLIVEAYEDKTNLRVVILGPPGSGKDTTAGDLVLHAVCDDFNLRAAWIMESEAFSRRRLAERISPYLTDEKTYRHQPLGPDTSIPTRSLITDYGPYKWAKGMTWLDGKPVERPTWNKHEMYFVREAAPESDPNLWATGISGALYGSRVDLMVVSDPFTVENQRGTMPDDQLNWFKGTVRTRLDEKGRIIILGTRVRHGDNYERLIDYFAGGSTIIYQSDDTYYTKYSNGTATVIYPAVYPDADGHEVSYWPERFPLHAKLVEPDGTEHDVVDLDEVELADIAGRPDVYRVDGLFDVRSADPGMFETLYQQSPPDLNVAGEFTEQLLDHCDDVTRTTGVKTRDEILILGVDPARTAGAAWVLLGVSRATETITLIDSFYGEQLGIEGIRNQLLVDPIFRYMPSYVVYEVNREAAVLELPDVQDAIKNSAAKLIRHHTTGQNRNQTSTNDSSVAAIAFDMRNGTIRFPTGNPRDREQVGRVKTQFQNWDRRQALKGHGQLSRTRTLPDDLTMAFWVAWRHGRTLLGKANSGYVAPSKAPLVTMKRWANRMATTRAARTPPAKPTIDLVAAYYGEPNEPSP